MSNRHEWITWMTKVVRPVLEAGSTGRLKALMPIMHQGKRIEDHESTHLEAVGRSLAGIAPWLEVSEVNDEERTLQATLRSQALATIDGITRPGSPDRCAFNIRHSIVDGAFLAHALLRAPEQLCHGLPPEVKANLIDRLKETRVGMKPHFNNWLLFSAMIESALDLLGEDPDYMRIDYALRQHEQWYVGDGIYGDGPEYHHDYYNSYVIHPMLVDISKRYDCEYPGLKGMAEVFIKRFSRFASIQERMINADGSFPAIGRSLTYRAGAFQALAQAALQKHLEDTLDPGAVRCALYAVIDRTLSADQTFDDEGWLRPGLAGFQPSMGEDYISTGSLYLCSTAFLPLGLSEDDPFWSADDADWTARKVWNGHDVPCDHALRNR